MKFSHVYCSNHTALVPYDASCVNVIEIDSSVNSDYLNLWGSCLKINFIILLDNKTFFKYLGLVFMYKRFDLIYLSLIFRITDQYIIIFTHTLS